MSQTPEYLYSELPAIELFKKLGFNYFDASIADTRESINEVILQDRLRQSLLKINPWLQDNTLEKVVRKLKKYSSFNSYGSKPNCIRFYHKKRFYY